MRIVNRKARYLYEIGDRLEAMMPLLKILMANSG